MQRSGAQSAGTHSKGESKSSAGASAGGRRSGSGCHRTCRGPKLLLRSGREFAPSPSPSPSPSSFSPSECAVRPPSSAMAARAAASAASVAATASALAAVDSASLWYSPLPLMLPLPSAAASSRLSRSWDSCRAARGMEKGGLGRGGMGALPDRAGNSPSKPRCSSAALQPRRGGRQHPPPQSIPAALRSCAAPLALSAGAERAGTVRGWGRRVSRLIQQGSNRAAAHNNAA